MPVSPDAAPSPPRSLVPVRRRPALRACDRCRRRKARCDFAASETLGGCTPCRDARERCAFDLPVGRRGPKAKRRATDASPRHVPPPSLLLQPPPGRRPCQEPVVAFRPPSTPLAASWESVHTDGPVSPLTVHSSLSGAPGSQAPSTAGQLWNQLSRTLLLRSFPVERIVCRCLDMFFEYLYPLVPLVHEPSLRDGLAFFLASSPSGLTSIDNCTPTLPSATAASSNLGPIRSSHESWPETTFTLITAVCAEAAFLLPKDIFPEGEAIADIFLQASRTCLNGYLEADLESPNASSVAIRYFHSNCVHASGKPKYSWHIFGEATRLAQVMHLHDESSFEGLYPLEAELRRRVFWIVYMGDKSAAILNNRPITIHKFSFESGITTAYPTGIDDEYQTGSPSPPQKADPSPEKPGKSFFIEGFNANLRLWQAASDLLLEIRLLDHQEQRHFRAQRSGQSSQLTPEYRQKIESLYVRFMTCLDNLPPYLQSYTFAGIANGMSDNTQSNQFLIQCANLQVSLHCLRMVITQKFEDLSYFQQGEQADLRKTEISRDMLRVIREAPFWSLQVNGEPYVEKIRLIGASLLEIIHRNQSSPLAMRARSDFAVLLDILTRLDSKASDALRNNSTSIL